MTNRLLRSLGAATALAGLFALAPLAPALAQGAAPAASATAPMAQPTAEMKSVLDHLQALGAKPIGTLSVAETRAQPTPADAVMAVMRERNVAPDPAAAAVKTRDIAVPGAAGDVKARVYTPPGEGPFPLVVYYHGGGWVIADIDTYDASARALSAGAKAVVVSMEYRHGPENKFPAAHEDAFAAYKWAVENSGALNADAKRIAVAGESAGGNLAANVALMARDAQVTQPVHQLLVYPIAGKDMNTPSYQQNAEAMPLSKNAMKWFAQNALPSMDTAADQRIDLVSRTDLTGLPPATVINAEIDPLRSEGETYAANLEKAGIPVKQMTYSGVTHEFFGMGTVVPEAKAAMTLATERLAAAFAGNVSGETTSATPAPRPAN